MLGVLKITYLPIITTVSQLHYNTLQTIQDSLKSGQSIILQFK